MYLSGYVDLGTHSLFGPVQEITDGSGNSYKLPSGTRNVKIQFLPSSTYYFSKSSGVASVKVHMVEVGNSSNSLELFTFTVSASETQKSGSIPTNPVELDLSQFANKYIGVKFSIVTNTTSTYPQLNNRKMPIKLQSNTAVVAGNKCGIADINQTGTSITAGTKMSNSNFSSGTKIQASTFNSQVLGL